MEAYAYMMDEGWAMDRKWMAGGWHAYAWRTDGQCQYSE